MDDGRPRATGLVAVGVALPGEDVREGARELVDHGAASQLGDVLKQQWHRLEEVTVGIHDGMVQAGSDSGDLPAAVGFGGGAGHGSPRSAKQAFTPAAVQEDIFGATQRRRRCGGCGEAVGRGRGRGR